MPFSLTKKDDEQFNEIFGELQEARSKLEDAVTAYNAGLADLAKPMQDAVEAYNAILQKARGFAEDIAQEAAEAIADKSDKWREGERGQAAQAWHDAYETYSQRGDLSVELTDDLEVEDPDDVGDFENLPPAAET